MRPLRERKRRGFTLIELIVVITIIGILAAAVAINAPALVERARKKRASADIKQIETAVQDYRMQTGHYPESLEEVVHPDSGPEGLQTESLLDEIPIDPWNEPYRLSMEGSKPIVISFGPDGLEGTEDDITSNTGKRQEGGGGGGY